MRRLKWKAIAVIVALLAYVVAHEARAEFDYLKISDPAPYAGYLISPAKEQELRLNDQKLKLNESIIKQYEIVKSLDDKHIDILQQRVAIYQNETIRMSKEIVEARGDGFWNKFLYFALGAVVTVGITYGVSQATR